MNFSSNQNTFQLENEESRYVFDESKDKSFDLARGK